MAQSNSNLNEVTNGINDIEIQASQIIKKLEKATNELQNNKSLQNAQKANAVPMPNNLSLNYTRNNNDNILLTLEQILLSTAQNYLDKADNEDSEDEENSYQNNSYLPVLDDISRISIVSHSILNYLTLLDRQHLQKVNTILTQQTNRWILNIFRLNLDYYCYYHQSDNLFDQYEGLVRIVRMLLHYKYPRYCDDGHLALQHSPPLLYSNSLTPLAPLQHICRQLGLPLSCIRAIECEPSGFEIDLDLFKQMIENDIKLGFKPLIAILDVNNQITGHYEKIDEIKEILNMFNIWLHLNGNSLSALPLCQQPANNIMLVNNERLCDSLTLNAGIWLDIPGLPIVTIYRLFETNKNDLNQSENKTQAVQQVNVPRESTLALIAGLGLNARRIQCLPLWCAIQSLGKELLYQRILQIYQSVENVWKQVNAYSNYLRILSPEPKITVLIEQKSNLKQSALLESAITCVVFQFVPKDTLESIMKNCENSKTENDKLDKPCQRVPLYFDKLNSWLGQVIQRDLPQLSIQICDLENYGLVLRYSPLDGGDILDTQACDIFGEFLHTQIDIMLATVKLKQQFKEIVEKTPLLQLCDVPEWAGLGGVRYVPLGWARSHKIESESESDTKIIATPIDHNKYTQELNRLNVNLVETLRSTDSAFSLGEANDGLACVRFGLVTEDTDLNALLDLVVSVGKQVEQNTQVYDSMSEIVKKGIETAMLDLQRENEERLWQEGILRQVPIVGTFYNWFSPTPQQNDGTTGIKGRTLDLTQGVIESTENIYKQKSQVHMIEKAHNNQSLNNEDQTDAAVKPPQIKKQLVITSNVSNNDNNP